MIALLDNLKTHLPFSLLDDESLKLIEHSAQVAYYPQSTTLIPQNTKASLVYYIIKGRVECLNEEEIIDIYQGYDTFGAIELIENKSSEYDYLVSEELICYEIPAKVFLKLTEDNKEFKTYFFSTIVDRMDMINDKNEFASIGDLMVSRVDKSILHNGCIVADTMPIVDALRYMDREGASCLLVLNEDGYGIVTDTNFRYYILNRDEEELKVVSQIQTYPAHSIKSGELLFNILLQMTEHSIKHLPVFDEDDLLIGVLEMIDLLSYFSNQSHLISVQMAKAQTLDIVISAAKRLEITIESLHAKGIKTRYIAKLVSEINRKMYMKIFDFIMPKEYRDKVNFILLGSEGRQEQILRTDQDNAIIFEDGFEPKLMKEVTQKFIEVLDEIGFPRCKGNVMIINPKWAKSLSKYKNDIDTWINEPSSDGFMDMAILFDSMSVVGNQNLHKELIAYLIQKAKNKKSLLPHFVRSIQSFESPLGMFSQFISTDKDHKNQIDIKKGALFALVHGVRGLALEHGITQTNTSQRIKELNNLKYLSKDDATNLMGALEVINTLRLQAQLLKHTKGEPIDNYISLANVSKIETDALKEALKTVNQFKKRISHHFHLSMVS